MIVKKVATQWLAALFGVFIFSGNAISASDSLNDCAKKPSYHCLVTFISNEVEQLENTEQASSAQIHWKFETQQNRATTKKNITSPLHAKLTNEERYLNQINKAAGKNKPEPPEVNAPFMDADAFMPDTLLVEQFTLRLEDSNANKTKRKLIEQTINSPQSDQTNQLIIEVARAEIISGAPQKGLNTLNTAHVDSFSDALLFQEKQFTSELAAYSEKLFLDPTFNQTRCNQNQNPTIAATDTFVSGQTVKLLNNINQIPSISLQTKLKLALLRLHKNAESCPLLTTFLINFFIQQEIYLYTEQKKSLLSLIYFARSIRRYYI